MLEYYDNSMIGGAGYDLGRNDIHGSRGGLRGCGCDRHEGHSLRSVVPAAVRRESLRKIRRKLQLSARLRHAGRDARAHALVLQTIWEIADYSDSKAIKAAKKEHNAATLRLLGRLRRADVPGFPVGASGCALCETCAIVEHEPCRYPDLYYSCMSAYCIFVRRLAEQCGMEYDCGPGLLAFFGMYVFD